MEQNYATVTLCVHIDSSQPPQIGHREGTPATARHNYVIIFAIPMKFSFTSCFQLIINIHIA